MTIETTPVSNSENTPLGGRQGLSAAEKSVKAQRRKYTKKEKVVDIDTPAAEALKFTREQAEKAAQTVVAVTIKPACGMLAGLNPAARQVITPDFDFNLLEAEEASVIDALSGCFETMPYNVVSKWLPWVSLIIATGMIAYPRIMAVMEIRKGIKAGKIKTEVEPEKK